jgi:cytochrome d ubiquinol oxidase subunit II
MLNMIWFILLTTLLTGYALLEGFDFGVGMLHLFARKDEDRRIFMNAIGPVWDGNEVWLITFGGALFAAFPIAYATVFSTFYTPFMLLLCALIFRAAALEFRSKMEGAGWRTAWDTIFSVSSGVAALLLGVAAGNAVRGLAIDERGVYQGGFFDFLTPFCLLTGLMTVAMFALHGALYLSLKTDGELKARLMGWAQICGTAVTALFIVVSIYGVAAIPAAHPKVITGIFGLGAVTALAALFHFLARERAGGAFLSSGAFIISLCLLFAGNMFPNLVQSTIDPSYHLTVFNAASSPKTLGIMLGITLCALPLVLTYSAWVHWVFRGKVKLDNHSY